MIDLAERRVLPDGAIRYGIRRLLARRLRDERGRSTGDPAAHVARFVAEMCSDHVAVAQDTANAQHYELPTEFFQTVLGPALKYSSCLWAESDDLRNAEERMLQLSCERAGIEDGMDVLDLGCGWGSMSLWIARHKPRCRVLAVSNSRLQGQYILERCRRDGLRNVEVITADMENFGSGRRFHRIVSVEMFEHMRNWPVLFNRVASWLNSDGAFFLHVFSHRDLAYFYEDHGSGDWMSRYFFTGGIMPSADLPFHLSTDLEVTRHWEVDGRHYSRTLEAWLSALDAEKASVMTIFKAVYGDDADRWYGRWRIFFMACSELFKYKNGSEWGVSHYLLEPTSSSADGNFRVQFGRVARADLSGDAAGTV